MAIITSAFRLDNKISLTKDVFEVTCSSSESPQPQPGQYVLFQLPSGLKRAYSVSFAKGGKFTFIIKRIPFEWSGSSEICDSPIGTVFTGMGPMWHFVLTDSDVPRLFLGTGTGFAPLYFQVRALEEQNFASKTEFVFGVRTTDDIFYRSEFERLTAKSSNFSFVQFLSQDASENARKGYVTDILTAEYVAQFSEFYICGSPAMVKSARAKLAELGVQKEYIKFEQY